MNTRDTIVAAAWTCIQERGLKRASIAEVARQAGVARGTVYEYFADKRELVDAVIAGVSAAIFKRMAQAMAHGRDLQTQLAFAAAYIARSRGPLRDGQRQFDETRAAILLADQSGDMHDICASFLEPYVHAARDRGEVRPDLDTRATSEWFSRILISLYTTPSKVLDLEDPDVAGRFVADHFSIGVSPPGSPHDGSTKTFANFDTLFVKP